MTHEKFRESHRYMHASSAEFLCSVLAWNEALAKVARIVEEGSKAEKSKKDLVTLLLTEIDLLSVNE